MDSEFSHGSVCYPSCSINSIRTPCAPLGWMKATRPCAPWRGTSSMSCTPCSLSWVKSCLNVRHLNADMMDAFAPLFQELGDAGVVGRGLHQFDVALADGQKGDLDLLVWDRHDITQRQAKRRLIDLQCFLDVAHDDADMVDFHGPPSHHCSGWKRICVKGRANPASGWLLATRCPRTSTSDPIHLPPVCAELSRAGETGVASPSREKAAG